VFDEVNREHIIGVQIPQSRHSDTQLISATTIGGIRSLGYSAEAFGRVTRAAAAQAAGLGTGISYRGERNLSLRRRIKPGYARGVVIGDLAGSPPCLWGVIVSLVSILCLSATHLRAPRPVYGA